MINQNFKLTLKIVYTVKHVISKIQSKISHGFHLKEEVVPIIQICKFFIIIFYNFSVFKGCFAKDKIYLATMVIILNGFTQKKSKILKKLKKTFKKINPSNVKEETLEELLFESMIFDDWINGKEISLKLIEVNKENITANLFLFVESF